MGLPSHLQFCLAAIKGYDAAKYLGLGLVTSDVCFPVGMSLVVQKGVVKEGAGRDTAVEKTFPLLSRSVASSKGSLVVELGVVVTRGLFGEICSYLMASSDDEFD